MLKIILVIGFLKIKFYYCVVFKIWLMKKLFYVVLVCAAVVAVLPLVSCGSSWNVEGNNIIVTVADRDTVVSRGTILLTPDSLRK